MKLPVYNIVLGGCDGLTKMSLVDYPAVESDFLAFQDKQPMKFVADEEQHIVFGCALRADFPIYRADERYGEYYVVFSKDVIRELYEKFMVEGRGADVNVQHTLDTNGVFLIQSFIKDSAKGINPVGFEDITDGSWFVAYKVLNEDVWNGVKQGKFNGFSVECYVDLQPVNAETDLVDDVLNEL